MRESQGKFCHWLRIGSKPPPLSTASVRTLRSPRLPFLKLALPRQKAQVICTAPHRRAGARSEIHGSRRAGKKIATFFAVVYSKGVQSCSPTRRKESMATYRIEPAPETLHGTFSRD